jgi:hypothetical protein
MKAFMFRPRASAAVLIALVLAACGGGGGSSSTSTITTTSQSASGTVTGFGSVYVDGVEFEDAKAYTRVENADGSYSPVALQLGQRVRVAHDSDGTASTVTVDAALIGTVAAGSIDTSALSFKVAGQPVKANIDSTAGQLTVYGGGYTAFTDIAAADLVEIHGSAVYDSTTSAYVVKAARIEKKAAISSVRVMGKIANLDTTAKTFTINSLSVSYASATLAPSTATLANDQTVAVWGPSASLVSSGSTLNLTASRVRVINSSLADTITSGTTQLGGLVSNYSASTGSFELEGVKVVVGTATLTPTGATIGNGAYVQVSGTVGADGSITASAIRVRQQSTVDDTASVRLTGAIESLTDQSSFVVRGVPVDAAALDVTAACPGVTLAAGTVVKVTATIQAGTDVVLASSLSCISATTYTMRSLSGTAGTVDTTAKTFILTTASATTRKVQWSDQTVFAGVTAAALDTASVLVEGYLDSAGTLVARVIRNPAVVSGRQDSDAYSGMENSSTRSWSHYRSGRR